MNKINCLSLNPCLDVSSQCSAVQATHKVRLEDQAIYPGGGAVNVARVIQLLGGSPSLTYVSGGEIGRVLTEAVRRLAIESHCIVASTDTRIAFTVSDQSSGLEYRFIPKGSALTESTLIEVLEQVESISPQFLVLSGSLPSGVGSDTYAHLALKATAQGTKVFLDCSGEALAATLETKTVYLMKPSFNELSQLAGKELTETSAIEFASSLVDSGSAANVAVSMGANGAFLVNKSGLLRSPALKVPVRSAVGAGDSFLAAMVHRIACKDTMDDALRWGMAAGAAAVTTKGTALCALDVVNQLLPTVEIIQG